MGAARVGRKGRLITSEKVLPTVRARPEPSRDWECLDEAPGAERWRLRGTRRSQRGWRPPEARHDTFGSAGARRLFGYRGEPGHRESGRRPPSPAGLGAQWCPTLSGERRGARAEASRVETSALGVQRTVWFDGIDDVLCAEASPRPLPAERAAGEVQVAAVLDSGRRLMAPGSGSL